ncbi:MAG: aminoacyl-tRNA hydrolase [Pirellulales bacterium]|nr:aminoacyl-tRNA hydrolase [Pirellulales bacterium]
MNRRIVVSDMVTIPEDELQWTFVRSGGPGGQNVNKVNSKAVLRWSVKKTQCLTDTIRHRFLFHYRNRINREGELVLSSQRYRDQALNAEDCSDKLRRLILAVAEEPRQRRPTKPPRSVTERRLADKRYRALKKSRRHCPDQESY